MVSMSGSSTEIWNVPSSAVVAPPTEMGALEVAWYTVTATSRSGRGTGSWWPDCTVPVIVFDMGGMISCIDRRRRIRLRAAAGGGGADQDGSRGAGSGGSAYGRWRLRHTKLA